MKSTIRPVIWGILDDTYAVIRAAARQRNYSAADIDAAAPEAASRGRRQEIRGAVAVLSLSGVITPKGSWIAQLFGGGGGLQAFRANFREALADDDVSAILLDIDSPGGVVDLVPETAAEIFAARGSKPIVAIANTMAASAAYWIASAADEIVVTPSGEVGSVGVFIVHDDWSKFNADFGVQPTYISAGRFKTDGNPDEPLSDSAREWFQSRVDGVYDMFTAAVAQGRGTTPSNVVSGYGQGRVVAAESAVELGMADRVETFEDTLTRLLAGGAAAAGLTGAAAVEWETAQRLLSMNDVRAAEGLESNPDPEPAPEPEPAPNPDPDPAPEPDPDPEDDPDPPPADDDDEGGDESPEAAAERRHRVASVLLG